MMERIKHGDGSMQVKYENIQELLGDLANRTVGEAFVIGNEVFEVILNDDEPRVTKIAECRFESI